MATKPNETYKWGENATHEQVAAYEDMGWPADNIPPKRTQFNWYQNLVGRWLEWVEGAVDELVDTVLNAWFVELPDLTIGSVPRVNGIYRYSSITGLVWTVLVQGDRAVGVIFSPHVGLEIELYDWDDLTSTWTNRQRVIERANRRSEILSDPISETAYVTPKGLVDYFNAIEDTAYGLSDTPHASGVYRLGFSGGGIAVVVGDHMTAIYNDAEGNATIKAFTWSNGAWT